jgi:Homeodomain-like domain
MPMGRPLDTLTLSEAERAQQVTYAQSRALPTALVNHAKVILLAVDGLPNAAVAAQINVTPMTVGKGRRRWRSHGLAGLYDATRGGLPRAHDDGGVAAATAQSGAHETGDGHALKRAYGSRCDVRTGAYRATLFRHVLRPTQLHQVGSSSRPIRFSSRRCAIS